MKIADVELARLATRLGRKLLRDGCMVATAESCTGGWIGKTMTDIAGSSSWFAEGFITYSNAAKVRTLRVPSTMLDRRGAVSEEVARAMAEGAIRRARADFGVAVTGIAGPGGAVPGKPVGTVWLAWAYRRGSRIRVSTERRQFRGDRESVRRKTVQAALAGLIKIPSKP